MNPLSSRSSVLADPGRSLNIMASGSVAAFSSSEDFHPLNNSTKSRLPSLAKLASFLLSSCVSGVSHKLQFHYNGLVSPTEPMGTCYNVTDGAIRPPSCPNSEDYLYGSSTCFILSFRICGYRWYNLNSGGCISPDPIATAAGRTSTNIVGMIR